MVHFKVCPMHGIRMRLAAMYSGGKDSTFAMYLAEQMGHEIVCLVTVRPEDRASWIFHTPNLSAVPAMAEAMGMELVTAVSDGTEEGDMAAMRDVLSGLDVDGIVVGALWSDYQWDRMNLICGDLGLVVLAPLWRKDQDMVYDEMVSAGIEAVIAGVFAEGLDGEWLGRRLDADTKSGLCRLRDRYGISIMGEGGEYESMTLDSPMHLKRLVISGSEKRMERNAGTLEVTGVALEEKPVRGRV
jgi:ABC transporter with metal-binding/Fe-S-binding domain ATP-binding protein